jgi:acetyltransferase-like isoleucine patch superfamily enzyme
MMVKKLLSFALRIRYKIQTLLFYRSLRKVKQIIINGKCLINKNCILEKKLRFEDGCIVIDSMIGFGTYLGSNCKMVKTKIGRFCSIAEGLRIAAGNHPKEKFVSTHPAFFSLSNQHLFNYVDEQTFEEDKYCDVDSNYFVCIGNDVWIGINVTILAGVSIGDGAIVGAGSVVTKSLEPYGIYAGVPARKIGSRFEEKEIEFLLDYKWWDKPEAWIKENAHLFGDIQNLMEKKTKA